jgi:hypothetical protein
MWTPQELARQKILDERARRSGDPADLDLACLHFNRVARRYDRHTGEAAAALLVEAALVALEQQRRLAGQDIPFIRPRTDETAYQRWRRLNAANTFVGSAMFKYIMDRFGIAPQSQQGSRNGRP